MIADHCQKRKALDFSIAGLRIFIKYFQLNMPLIIAHPRYILHSFYHLVLLLTIFWQKSAELIIPNSGSKVKSEREYEMENWTKISSRWIQICMKQLLWNGNMRWRIELRLVHTESKFAWSSCLKWEYEMENLTKISSCWK